MKIKMEFTVDELNIIKSVLTGHEKGLEDLYDAVKGISANAKDIGRQLMEVKELNKKLRDRKWLEQFSGDMRRVLNE